MTQLSAASRSEADTLHAAVRAYAQPHLDTAAALAAQLHEDMRDIAERLPDGVREKIHVQELSTTAQRYAVLLGYTTSADEAELAPTIGLARRVAVAAINDTADRHIDSTLVAWAQGLDLPLMDLQRVRDAALIAAAALTNKRATGVALTPTEAAQELGLQMLQQRQADIRASQRDHVRTIDGLDDIETVRAYPASAAWP
jgi:hypothetical protein